MGKLILLLILVAIVWWMWRKLQSPARDTSSPPAARPAESMVACAHCGINQPRSECIESDGRLFCCEAHRRAAEAGSEER